jgi:hypothetical protein
MILLMLGFGAPVFAQETEKPKEEAAETDKPEGEGEAEAAEDKQKMTDEGEKLFKDVERIYAKYYDILLEKFKANEPYKAEDVWNTAIKEAKNAKYKDAEEFQKALQAMQRKDRVFKKKLRELMVNKAKEYAEAIEEATKDE